jgi:CubicO group peptidase (beta-lactamase class C family)
VGIIIERVTGVNLQEYFQENVFEPLGVEDFGFWINEAMKTKFCGMSLRKGSDQTVVGVRHPQSAALEDPCTKVEGGGSGGCFGSVQGYSSIAPSPELNRPQKSLTDWLKR